MKLKGTSIPISKEILKDGFRPLYAPVAFDRCSEGHVIKQIITQGSRRLPCGCPYPPDDPAASKFEGIPEK